MLSILQFVFLALGLLFAGIAVYVYKKPVKETTYEPKKSKNVLDGLVVNPEDRKGDDQRKVLRRYGLGESQSKKEKFPAAKKKPARSSGFQEEPEEITKPQVKKQDIQEKTNPPKTEARKNEDKTDRLKKNEFGDKTDRLKKSEAEDKTDRLRKSEVEDKTDRLKKSEPEDKTDRLRKSEKEDKTDRLRKNEDKTDRLRAKPEDKTDRLRKTEDKTDRLRKNEDKTDRLRKPKNEDKTDRLRKPQDEDKTDRLRKPQEEDKTDRLRKPQNEDKTDRLKKDKTNKTFVLNESTETQPVPKDDTNEQEKEVAEIEPEDAFELWV